MRGLVVLLCGGSQLTQLALNERGGGGGGGVGPWVWGLLSPLEECGLMVDLLVRSSRVVGTVCSSWLP